MKTQHTAITKLLTGQHEYAMQWLDNSMRESAAGVAAAIEANALANSKSNDALGKAIMQGLREQESAAAIRRAYELYGPQRISKSGCNQFGGAKGSNAGRGQESANSSKTLEKTRVYDTSFTTQAQVLAANSKRKDEAFKPEPLFTAGRTLTTEEEETTADAIKMLINPNPKARPQVSKEQESTVAGKEYKYLTKLLDMRYDAAKMPLIESQSLRVQNMKATAGQKSALQEIYGGTIPPGKIVGDMISRDVFLEIGALQFSTQSALQEIVSTDNEVALLQKIAQMNATSLELQYRNYQKLSNMANLDGMQHAEDTRVSLEPRVEEARVAMRRSSTKASE